MAEERAKEMKMGRPMVRSMKPSVEHPGQMLKRILGYVFRNYKIHLVIVVLCIVGSVLANVQGTMFMRTLIDSYIRPMMNQSTADFGPLAHAMGRWRCSTRSVSRALSSRPG